MDDEQRNALNLSAADLQRMFADGSPAELVVTRIRQAWIGSNYFESVSFVRSGGGVQL